MDDEYEIDRSGLMGIIGNENGYEGVKSNEWESINEWMGTHEWNWIWMNGNRNKWLETNGD